VQTNLKAFDAFGRDGLTFSGSSESGLDAYSCSFALEQGVAEAYNEEAFQYFLEIERKRSAVSNRQFLLMLVEFHKHPPSINPDIDPATAARLFSILRATLRETDLLGWYREARVAGAVLIQHGENQGDLSVVVRQRVNEALEKEFPQDRSRGFTVRVFELSPRQAAE